MSESLKSKVPDVLVFLIAALPVYIAATTGVPPAVLDGYTWVQWSGIIASAILNGASYVALRRYNYVQPKLSQPPAEPA